MKLTFNQKKLARLVTGGKGVVEIIAGSASRPIKPDEGDEAIGVFVGEHFWWGFLVPSDRSYEAVIAEWESGKGRWYSS